MPKVYHAIHTNAYSQDAQGFRSFVVPALKLPSEQGQRLDQWLRGLAPGAGDDVAAGVAVDSFKVDGVVYACLAMVDPDFALDEHRRPGGFWCMPWCCRSSRGARAEISAARCSIFDAASSARHATISSA
ncbi:MAG: hypothetical protein HC897_14990 [Thermoanaerobaculia bacterium]|nr:hypothetical protein [Thermoanaerobaculia bacterium]